jgi:HNH endonuclease
MRGSSYSTADGSGSGASSFSATAGLCQIRGRRCTGIATTVHHILPSSTHPHLFFDPSNLQAACKPCNYGDGAVVRTDNRTNRQLVAHLESVVEEQAAEIEVLRRELERQDEPEPVIHRAEPRIH